MILGCYGCCQQIKGIDITLTEMLCQHWASQLDTGSSLYLFQFFKKASKLHMYVEQRSNKHHTLFSPLLTKSVV